MKKTLVFAIIFTCAMAVFGLEVDIQEIMSAKRINFLNYKGKVSKIDSRESVKSIGVGLARRLKRVKPNQTAKYYLKYSVTHITSQQEPKKYSADIFSIDKKATVGHINNLRRILAGYFQAYYNYSLRDAQTLAVFTTYYNAVYRNNMEYFGAKYKKVVMSQVTKDNAGLSTKYYEWAGQTKMLIPLTADSQRGKLAKLDPYAVSGKGVRAAMRKDDKNIRVRKRMVKIKEKELKKEKKALVRKEKGLVKKKKKVQEKKQIIAKKKEIIKRKKARLEKQKTLAKKEKDPQKRAAKERAVSKEEKALKKEETKVEQAEKIIAKEERAAQSEEKQAEKTEAKVAEREKDLREEKKEIEQDEINKAISAAPSEAKKKLTEKAEKLKQKEDELDKREDKLKQQDVDKSVYANKLYYLKIKEYLENGHYNNEMYLIDAVSRRIIFKSPVKKIAGRKYEVFSDGVVVITHVGNERKGHRLTMLDREKLEIKKIGDSNVFWRSFVIIRDEHIYAIVNEGTRYFLARFDSDLKEVARSDVRIAEDTFISFYEEYIYINSEDKQILALKKKDLSLLEIIKP
jgi:hypothetical protein